MIKTKPAVWLITLSIFRLLDKKESGELIRGPFPHGNINTIALKAIMIATIHRDKSKLESLDDLYTMAYSNLETTIQTGLERDKCFNQVLPFGIYDWQTPNKYVKRISITMEKWEGKPAGRLVSLRLSNDLVHLLNLSQGSLVGAQSLLGQLLGTLLAGVSEQLNQSSLVWSQARDLRDNASHESSSVGKSSLFAGKSWHNLLLGGFVTLVQTDSDTWLLVWCWWIWLWLLFVWIHGGKVTWYG